MRWSHPAGSSRLFYALLLHILYASGMLHTSINPEVTMIRDLATLQHWEGLESFRTMVNNLQERAEREGWFKSPRALDLFRACDTFTSAIESSWDEHGDDFDLGLSLTDYQDAALDSLTYDLLHLYRGRCIDRGYSDTGAETLAAEHAQFLAISDLFASLRCLVDFARVAAGYRWEDNACDWMRVQRFQAGDAWTAFKAGIEALEEFELAAYPAMSLVLEPNTPHWPLFGLFNCDSGNLIAKAKTLSALEEWRDAYVSLKNEGGDRETQIAIEECLSIEQIV